MGKKEVEIDCFNRLINSIPKEKTKARFYYNLIKSANNCSSDNERPDFILEDVDYVLGLEHCMVDGLYNEHYDSHFRKKNNKINQVVREYARDKDIENGLEATKDIIMSEYDSYNIFNYMDFIKKFEHICMHHNKKCFDEKILGYRSNIGKYNKRKKYLGCLIEIPLPDIHGGYIIKIKDNEHVQILNNIPVTKDMVSIIQKMDGFDFVVICAYSQRFSIATYFDREDIQTSIKEQRIKLVDEFRYNQHYIADNIEIQKGKDCHTLVFTGHFKN